MAQAYEAWAQLGPALDLPDAYRPVGHLQLFERDADLDRAAAMVQVQRRHGVPTETLDRESVRRLEPGISAAIVAAVHCPRDGVADHAEVTRATARAAARCGARIVEHAPVRALHGDAARITAVVTDQETVTVGRAAIIACNAGAAPLLAAAGVDLPLSPVLPQVLITAPVEPGCVRHLIGHAHRPLAMKQLPDGRVMITGGRLGTFDAATERGTVRASEVDANRDDAAAVFPGLARVDIEVAVADRTEAVTADLLPIVDQLPGADNELVATGWSGHGWAIAPVVGELLSEWARTATRPGLLAPFALARPGLAGYRL
jgi:sarcosine oxidase subunit beta